LTVNSLILLPGLDGTGTLFGPLIRELPASIETRVVAYPRDHCLSYAELGGVVRAALPTDRPFVLLGESFSGPLAIRMAAAHAPGLAGTILSCSFVRNPYPFTGWAAGLVRSISPNVFPATWRTALVLGFEADGPIRTMVDQAVASVSSDVLAHRAASVLELDDTALLSRVTTPVLYLRASQDSLIPPGAGEWIRERVAPCTVIDIDGPHMLLQAKAKECASAIGAWMQQLSGKM
jgi:pimeloyl-[acyl-carrier protein] methyl ester esterase